MKKTSNILSFTNVNHVGSFNPIKLKESIDYLKFHVENKTKSSGTLRTYRQTLKTFNDRYELIKVTFKTDLSYTIDNETNKELWSIIRLLRRNPDYKQKIQLKYLKHFLSLCSFYENIKIQDQLYKILCTATSLEDYLNIKVFDRIENGETSFRLYGLEIVKGDK